MPNDQIHSALTPEEQKFFETGDASVLQLSQGTPAAQPEPAAQPASVPAAQPEASPALASPAGTAASTPAATPDALTLLQSQLAAEQASRARLEASIADITARLTPKASDDPVPDPVTDPVGNMMHQLAQVNKQMTALQEQILAQQQQQAQAAQFNEFSAGMKQIRDEYTKTNPDFPAAYAHLRNIRSADLRDVGVPEADIPRALLQDELAIAQAAVQKGRNPAQVFHEMAKRAGFVAAPNTPAQDAAAKIAAIAAAQNAHNTPPATGAPAGPLTVAGLKDASDAELNKVILDDASWNRLMGGQGSDIFAN